MLTTPATLDELRNFVRAARRRLLCPHDIVANNDTWRCRNCELSGDVGQSAVSLAVAAYDLLVGELAIRTQWQPIETAPRDRDALHKMRAVGGRYHRVYGWLWGRLDYHPDKHADNGGYFMADGNDPTHWTTLPAPPPTTAPNRA
jgi:hypothetical protein